MADDTNTNGVPRNSLPAPGAGQRGANSSQQQVFVPAPMVGRLR